MSDLSKIPNSQLMEAAAAWRAHDRNSSRPSLFGFSLPAAANTSTHDRIDDLISEIIRLRAELEKVQP